MTYHHSLIFLNDNIVSHAYQRGITRYFNNIMDGVIASFGRNSVVYSPIERDYVPARHIPALPSLRGERLRISDRLASFHIFRHRPNIIVNAYYGKVTAKVPQTCTVYDMIHELFPQYFPRARPHNRRFIAEKRRNFERASLLFCISDSTAQDLLNYYPDIDPNKIKVTQLGVDDIFFQPVQQQKSHTNKPYFLYVGHRDLYKNFLGVVHAFGKSGLAKNFDLQVITSRNSKWTPEEVDCFHRYHIQDAVRVLQDISDIELQKSYAGAVAFLYPSEYEGFGLPVAEAMASGTIVATSNRSSMPEVGGNAAVYFDPQNVESMCHCLQQIARLSNKERDERIALGLDRAKIFTWERCQQRTVEALASLLEEHS